MTALVVLLIAGMLTYLLRASMVHALHGRALSPRVSGALRAAVPAGLAAMVAMSIMARSGDGTSARTVALVIAAVVARFTHHALAVVGAGMAAIWALTAAGV